MQWHQVAQGALGSPSLGVFQEGGEVTLGNMVSGHSGSGLGLDLGILQVSNLNDPVIL